MYRRNWQQTVGDVIFWTVILLFLALSTCLWHWHKTPGRIVTCFVDVGINACTFLQATAAGSVITERMQALDQVLGDIYLLHHSDRLAALDLTDEKVMPYEALTGSDDVNASLHVVGLLLSRSPRRLRPAPATPRAVSHPPAGALRALREAHALLTAAAASCGRALYVRLCFALATAFTSFVCFGYLTLAVTLDLRPVWFQDSKIAKLSLCAGWMGIFVALFLQLVLTWQGATTAGSAAETRARALLLLPAAAGSNAAESQAELQRLAETLKPRGLLAIDGRLLLAGASAAATSLVVLLQFHTAEAVLGP